MSNDYEVRRYERRVDPMVEAEVDAVINGLRPGQQSSESAAIGRLSRGLPPFQRTPRVVDMSVPCARCGKRRGLHRWGDEACPNPYWKPHSGRQEFQGASDFEAART